MAKKRISVLMSDVTFMLCLALVAGGTYALFSDQVTTGADVVYSIHSHQIGDEWMASLLFRQIYGGGHGVYGAPEHENVSEVHTP